MSRFLIQLLALLIGLHAPIAGAAVSLQSCGDGDTAMQRVAACPDCASPSVSDPASKESGCPMGDLATAQCIAACVGMSGLSAHPTHAVQYTTGERVADAPCERYASLARTCPKPPPRISL